MLSQVIPDWRRLQLFSIELAQGWESSWGSDPDIPDLPMTDSSPLQSSAEEEYPPPWPQLGF